MSYGTISREDAELFRRWVEARRQALAGHGTCLVCRHLVRCRGEAGEWCECALRAALPPEERRTEEDSSCGQYDYGKNEKD